MRLPAILLLVTAAFAADEAALAIGEKISGHVGFYTAEGKRLGGVKVGTHPHEIALSPDGKTLYISDNGILWMTDEGAGGNTISVIDVAARRKLGVIDLGANRRPHGLALDAKSGRLLSTIENPDGLLLIDAAARKVLRKFDVQGADPHMVLLGPGRDWAFVSNTGSNNVAAVHLESGAVKLIPVDARPQGGVLTRDGKLIYLTCGDGNSIAILDPAKKERVGSIATGRGPARVELTPDEKTLVYNLGEGEAIAFADVALRKQTTVLPIGGRPLSMTLSRDGKLAYLGIQDQDKIVVVSVQERKIVRTFQTPKGAGPDPVIPLR
ncbi:MAG: hypothetical protein ACRD96_24780 [Bryobacteraceae bacterium]